MQEFNTVLAALENGLPPEEGMPVNSDFASAMTNLKPDRAQKAISPTPISYPVTTSPAITLAWPYPSLLRGEKGLYLCDAQKVYSVAEGGATWAGTEIPTYSSIAPASALAVAASSGEPWHGAFFDSTFFLCNGSVLVMNPILPGSTTKAYTHSASLLGVRCVARHRNRLLVSLSGGTWLAGSRWTKVAALWKNVLGPGQFTDDRMTAGTGFVLWCERGGGAKDRPFVVFLAMLGLLGDAAFDAAFPLISEAIEAHEIGMTPLSSAGSTVYMKTLGDDVNIYDSKCLFKLVPNDNEYYEAPVEPFGCLTSTVGGDETQHVFMTAQGELYRWAAGDFRPKRLGFKQYIGAMTGKLVVAHDPVLHDFWIGDGVTGYVLSPAGLGGPVYEVPTSLVRTSKANVANTLVGPHAHLGSANVLFTSGPVDFANRNKKHSTGVQAQMFGMTGKKAKMDWRDSGDGTFKATPWVPFGPSGVAYASCSFVEGKVSIQGVPASGGAKIQRIELRFQNEDRTHNRGTSASTADPATPN